MKKSIADEIHKLGMAFAEHPRAVQAISLDAWNNLKEVNAHFIRTGVGPVYEIVMESLGTCSDFDFVSVKLTDMGLAHFETRHNTPDQGVTSECCTGRLRLLGPYNVLQQEFQVIKAGNVEMEWRPVPTV